ncbi:mitochondrial carrier [Hanseniaspora valbyensis NRRL Y-1626]|uniref:Mitochondrial carrier n=1 Tax=Hanseniaspora valbyensis NRRL Y-1626 TaxID=766949 RepID=A0A1B7TBX1_9ASCO|nr:mitochondrial carrier [Hanseniaspora valbyensis NRRL Y-1626]
MNNISANYMNELFNTISKGKNTFNYTDFENYYTTTIKEIQNGFHKIDLDQDGLVKLNDVNNYLTNLSIKTSGKDGQLRNGLETDKDYKIGYKDWENFLIFVPRHNNSRLETAFKIYSNVKEQESEHKEGVTQHFNTNSLKYFLAGGTAGVISRTCTAPFDRIKVFLIANDRTLYVSDVLRTIYKKAGLKGFYVGNGLSALKIFPESAIKFGSFELVKKIIFPHSYNNMKENPLGNYLCGGIAGCMAQLFVYPIDTIKYRMQCENVRFASYNSPQHNNLKKIVTEAYKQHGGIKAFYRGLPAGLAGMFPYAAIDLGTFNLLKNIASQYYFPEEYNDNEQLQQHHLPNMVLLPLGAISGSIGASIVYPVNLLRTRLQAQGTFAHPHRYNGFFDCCAKTVTREGVKGLYKGLLPNLVKVCPSVAISYFCYENFKRLLDLKN